MEPETGKKLESEINYYIIAAIFISVLFFIFANALEPQVNEQLDFFELIFVLAYAAPGVFSFVIAKRYWPSKVFGKAYLSLGIAYTLTAIGAFLFDYYQIWEQVENPYPSWIDVLFASFYPFAIYHIRTNIYYFRRAQKPKLQRNEIALLILLPLGVTSIYAFGLLVPTEIGQIESDPNTTFNLVPDFLSHVIITQQEPDQQFYNGFYTGLYFVAGTTFTFSWTIIGVRVFKDTVLGVPWGLLLVGIGLAAIADVSYYYTSIYEYDRTNPIIGIWVLGCIIVCYALYLHKKQL